jgi:hypothetical protein
VRQQTSTAFATEISLVLNLMIWNAAIYSTPVAQDIVMDGL